MTFPEFASAGRVVYPQAGAEPVLRIMSHNLFGRNYDMESVREAVRRENPDILTVQEYFVQQRGALHALLVEEYPYFSICAGGRRAQVAIYARLQFELGQDSVCPSNLSAGTTEIARLVAHFGNGISTPFTVMTTHLNWPVRVSAFRRSDADFIGRIGAMTTRKSNELGDLADAVARIDRPLIVTGDFNSTPWSHEFRRFLIAGGLSRHGFNIMTYPAQFYFGKWVETLPFMQLDHAFTRNGVVVHEVHSGDPSGSDHLPLIATFSLPPIPSLSAELPLLPSSLSLID